jgi:hypothetical protein
VKKIEISESHKQLNTFDLGTESTSNIERRPYSAPVLNRLGKLKKITLGGSPGIGDSSNGGVQKPPSP